MIEPTTSDIVVQKTPADRLRRSASSIVVYALLLLVAALIIVPVVYAVISAFRSTGQLASQPFGWPSPWVPENYTSILTSSTFWLAIYNSLFIGILTTILVVAIASMVAFIFSRYSFRGREVLFTYFTLGLLFPVAVAILPLWLLERQLGLVDHAWGVILPQVAFGLPTTIIILRPFFKSIPVELEDAAAIDGCTRFGFFWRILLPLSRPVLGTVGVLAIVGSWNAFLLPLVILNNPSAQTLPLAVQNFSTQYSQDTAKVLAFTVLSMVPALLFYVAAERQIIGGLTGGAVKG